MRTLLLMLLLGAAASASAQVQAPVAVGSVAQSEAAIREMPLLERPNRLGHFYGNTVRRRHYGTMFVNRMHSDRPVARYFYRAR